MIDRPASTLSGSGAAAFVPRRPAQPKLAKRAKAGGARRDRTDDLVLVKHALSQLSYGPETGNNRSLPTGSPSRSSQSERRLVGLGRLELPTSRLSSARSNQLSYKPLTHGAFMRARDRNDARCNRTSAAPGACSSAKKEKRRRRNPANGTQTVWRPSGP